MIRKLNISKTIAIFAFCIALYIPNNSWGVIIRGGVTACYSYGSTLYVHCGNDVVATCVEITAVGAGALRIRVNAGGLSPFPSCLTDVMLTTIPGKPTEDPLERIPNMSNPNLTSFDNVETVEFPNGESKDMRKVMVIESMPSFREVSVRPNPARNKEVRFQFRSDATQNITVEVYDIDLSQSVQKQFNVGIGLITQKIDVPAQFQGTAVFKLVTIPKIFSELIYIQ